MLPILLAVSVAVALALTVPTVRLAARRTVTMPIEVDVAAEASVLGRVLTCPAEYPKVSTLTVDDFADPDHRLVWQAIVDTAHVPAVTALTEKSTDADITAAGDAVAAHVPDLSAALTGRIDTGTLTRLADAAAVDSDALLRDGAKVLAGGEARGMLQGATPIEYGNPENGEPLLLRRYQAPSHNRTAFTALLLLAGLTAATLIATTTTTTVTAALLTYAALTLLTVGSAVWTLVDHDTMYIDTRTFWPAAAASWALTVAAAVTDSDPGRLIAGAAAAIVTVVTFEGTNLLYRLVRGRHGLGSGDTMLALATVGVPAAAAGAWTLGYAAVLTSLGLAIVGWLIMRTRAQAGLAIPFAFGPYLASGWMLAAIGWAAYTAVTG